MTHARRWLVAIADDDGDLVCAAQIAATTVTHITAALTANNTARIEHAGQLAAVGHAHPGRTYWLHRWPANDTTRLPVTRPVAPPFTWGAAA